MSFSKHITAQKILKKYELQEVKLNVLNIERTFVDKIMSVKRHAICGNIEQKVRHIYDVTRLFGLPEIKNFLDNKDELKRLIRITKDTDKYYLLKRNTNQDYDPTGKYDFPSWKHCLTEQVRSIYENLHTNLLYTVEKQNFDEALTVFEKIDKILNNIHE